MPFIEIDERFYSLKDIRIERDNKDFPKSVAVNNSLGKTIFVCDQSWSDEQILKTIEVANHAFKLGKMKGSGDAFDKINNHVRIEKSRLNLD